MCMHCIIWIQIYLIGWSDTYIMWVIIYRASFEIRSGPALKKKKGSVLRFTQYILWSVWEMEGTSNTHYRRTSSSEDYLTCSLCTLYLLVCQVAVTLGGSVFVGMFMWHLWRTIYSLFVLICFALTEIEMFTTINNNNNNNNNIHLSCAHQSPERSHDTY